MLNTTRTRLGSLAGLAVGLVILVPALAEAQLFPNRTIRREKPSCATEPPFYKQVRRDYFGYYPTCWSRFPAGWGCPCPDTELQAMRAEFVKTPPDINRKAGNGAGPDEAAPMDETNPETKPLPGEENKLPLPPGGTSPFEMDPKPKLPAAPGAGSGTGSNSGASLSPTSPANMDLPTLPSTSPTSRNESNPGGMTLYPDEATLTSTTTSNRPDLGPLPNAPTPAPFNPDGGSNLANVPVVADPVLGTPAPAQAPKRRSLLGQLFGRNNTTTQNR